MHKTIFTLLALTFLVSFSCEPDNVLNPKPPDDLPAITTNGAHTFGCLINGEVWRPFIENKPIWESALEVRMVYGGDYNQVHIIANRESPTYAFFDGQMGINVWWPVLGENEITPSKGIFTRYVGNGSCRYRVDTSSSHIMNIIHLDTVNFVVSGTFEFVAISDECQDTIRVTEGRFDG